MPKFEKEADAQYRPWISDDLFCLWFEDNWRAHDAWVQLMHKELINDSSNIVYLKDMRTGQRGWGFKNHELGLMCKLVTGG